ncbi:MAG: tubulin-like doman-containing protein, partial [Faecousia sp.]
MAIDLAQKQIYTNRIKKMKEDGFFLPTVRGMSGDTRYLIVSFGGTGADALFGVKKAFEEQLKADELKTRIRFLAIDTDKETQKQTKEVIKADGTKDIVQIDALSNEQFYLLSGAAARQVYDKEAHVQDWINPKLVDQIRTESTYLCGDGASGTRQVGRLTLYPAPTVAELRKRISALVGSLTNGNAAPLKVFILSGIAGGTGSGTIIDLSYLIRSTIEGMPGGIGGVESPRVSYAGFILLPPTGTSTDPTYIARGNRNGYAALKEINHYMTLPERGEAYSLVYGDGSTVVSKSKIFNICYLMDGVRAGVAFENPRSVVIRVLSECMLDMVSSNHTTDGVVKVQTVDSFMNDHPASAKGMVSAQSITHAMRDADYIYCALGHSEFAMPINEIKLYVAKVMFDRIYSIFRKCENVTEQDVDEFLKRVINRGVSGRSAIASSVNRELSDIFCKFDGMKGGPYYVINLLHDVPIGIEKLQRKLFKPCSKEQLNDINEACAFYNREIFDVYTMVMDAMKSLMGDQFNSIVTGGINGLNYSFIPQSMGDMDGSQIVIKYLNGLINGVTLQNLTNDMLKEMVDHREEWTALVKSPDPAAGTNAAAAMRRFWNEKLDAIVNSTMEDFLIKYYSGDPGAHYDAANDAATRPYLEKAAELIYKEMLSPAGGNAQAMAEFTPGGLSENNFNGHTYLLVPKTCPHLQEELSNVAKNHAAAGNDVQVCTSEGSDRITCYKQYTSIPAFKLAWVCRAEPDYEQGIATVAGVGTHMSETVGGKLWKNFPNLLPVSTWPEVPVPGHNYTNKREAVLANSATAMFQQAKDLKLTTAMHGAADTQNLVYEVRILPQQYRPDENLLKEIELCPVGSDLYNKRMEAINAAADKIAMALFTKDPNWTDASNLPAHLENIQNEKEKVAFERRKLHFPSSVLTVGPADVAPEGWDETMAACMLRKLPETMSDLNATLIVMNKLKALVQKTVKSKELVKVFAQYVATGMFTFNTATCAWQYTGKDGFSKDLAYIPTPMEECAKYYFMFCAYRSDSDAIDAAVRTKFLSVVPDMNDPATRAAREQAFRDACSKLAAELAPWKATPSPLKPFEQFAAAKGYSLEAIQNFYRTFIPELELGI